MSISECEIERYEKVEKWESIYRASDEGEEKIL